MTYDELHSVKRIKCELQFSKKLSKRQSLTKPPRVGAAHERSPIRQHPKEACHESRRSYVP